MTSPAPGNVEFRRAQAYGKPPTEASVGPAWGTAWSFMMTLQRVTGLSQLGSRGRTATTTTPGGRDASVGPAARSAWPDYHTATIRR